jgi:kynurenine formamidase
MSMLPLMKCWSAEGCLFAGVVGPILMNGVCFGQGLLSLIGQQTVAATQPTGHETRGTQERWIDLTHEFSSETIYWPTAERFKLTTVAEGVTDKGYYYSAYSFCAAEHGGTHLDAPVHFAKGGQTVSEIPLDNLIGDAVVIDVSRAALADRDYRIGADDFAGWEKRHGRIRDRSIVLLRTGYDRFWPDPVKYMGTAKRGAEGVKELHFPGLHPEGAHFLVQQRRAKAVGLDTPSIDFGQSTQFESHQILAEGSVPVMENLARLDRLPATGVWVVALPMKIRGGSGGPLRVVARVPSLQRP